MANACLACPVNQAVREAQQALALVAGEVERFKKVAECIEEVAGQLHGVNRGLLARAAHDARNAASSILLLDAISYRLAAVLPDATEITRSDEPDARFVAAASSADLP